jgi:hypothetical protein
MNQIFNFRRFRLLLKLEIAEKGRNYLMMGGLLVAIMLMLMLPIVFIRQNSQILIMLHALALFMVVVFGGSLYTSLVFSQYGSPATGISAIMIPASRLEKFTAILFLNLCFAIPFILLFLKLHYGTLEYANSLLRTTEPKYKPIPEGFLTYFVNIYIIAQGWIFLGSIYFRKSSFIKSAILFVLTYLVVCGLYLWQALYLTGFPSKLVSFPFTNWEVWYYKLNKNFYVPFPALFENIVYGFPFFLVVAMWYIAYVRLSEKQI